MTYEFIQPEEANHNFLTSIQTGKKLSPNIKKLVWFYRYTGDSDYANDAEPNKAQNVLYNKRAS